MNKMRRIQLLTVVLGIALFFLSCEKEQQPGKKEQFIDSLMAKMTLDEKIGQMNLLTSGWTQTGPTMNENYKKLIREGKCGNVFNAFTVEYSRKLQEMAVEETRLGIPLLFGYDVIHGFKTIFPIPLAESCSWDPELIKESARLASREAAASGINWTFNPMVDISRDPRWGRIAEGPGEDPYLGSLIGKAKVEGHQGEDLSNPLTLAACVKHFAAYGDPRAGRDYNTVDMSRRRLKSVYLPPYKAAIDAGAASVMTAFNELFGIPASGSHYLMTEILRDQWNYKGMVVSDYTAIEEMIDHGYARDEKHAGELALKAGVDMDMQGETYLNHLKTSLEEGKITEEQIDQAVRRILCMKYDLGLFEDPYRYLDRAREKNIVHSQELMEHALKSARESVVLLKNEKFHGKKLLPFSKNILSIGLIGPLADNQTDMLGTWHASGTDSLVTTVKEGLAQEFPQTTINYARGCGFNGDDRSGFSEALYVARNSEVVVMAVGENMGQSGEAASRASLGLPGVQKELVKEILTTGKPIIVLIMAGRPLAIPWIDENVPAILNTWHLGTKAGDAIADILAGETNPSGKLTATFPRDVGQVPIYYNVKNTGRPFEKNNKYTSKYLDMPNEPLYPFGYGLSYTTFEYSDMELSKDNIVFNEALKVRINVKNTGDYTGEEVVQLYTRDLVGSVTRPVKELKRFKKIRLAPGEEKAVTFLISSEDLRFYDPDMNYIAEPGKFKVFVGTNSSDVMEKEFELVKE
jgi:beta-glucosidase